MGCTEYWTFSKAPPFCEWNYWAALCLYLICVIKLWFLSRRLKSVMQKTLTQLLHLCVHLFCIYAFLVLIKVTNSIYLWSIWIFHNQSHKSTMLNLECCHTPQTRHCDPNYTCIQNYSSVGWRSSKLSYKIPAKQTYIAS